MKARTLLIVIPLIFGAIASPINAAVLSAPFKKTKVQPDLLQDGPLDFPKSTFIRIDNSFYADINDLLDDPFLLLRAQFPAFEEEERILMAWDFAAKMKTKDNFPTEEKAEFSTLKLFYDKYQINDGSGTFSSGKVINQYDLFDGFTPLFTIDTEGYTPNKVFWKISVKNDTRDSVVVLQGISLNSPHIELTSLQETSLEPMKEYVFQYQIEVYGEWATWSEPFIFKVSKPNRISKVDFNKVSKGQYEISWTGDDDKDIRYLIYASNSIDFIPSLYYEKHVKGISNGVVSKFDLNKNLVAETKDQHIAIDGKYAYYRIIPEKNGSFGNPSELIYVYDNELPQSRDVLAYDETSASSTRRSLEQTGFSNTLSSSKSLNKGKHITDHEWSKAKPYLLPENHPMKARMDRIFSKRRASQDAKSMRMAGFLIPEPRGLHRPVVTGHSILGGYLVKLFLDTQKGINDTSRLTRRVVGAESVKEAVQRLGYEQLFKVPKKWLYPLPDEPNPKTGVDRKKFVLLVQNMNILSSKTNRKQWKGPNIEHSVLDAVYTLFEDQGLADSTFAFNIPFDHEGYIAVIDTEVHHVWPVPFEKFSKCLSPTNQNYWRMLIRIGGPQNK